MKYTIVKMRENHAEALGTIKPDAITQKHIKLLQSGIIKKEVENVMKMFEECKI